MPLTLRLFFIAVIVSVCEDSTATDSVSDEDTCHLPDQGVCPTSSDDIDLMRVSLLQTSQHVYPAVKPTLAEKRGNRNGGSGAKLRDVLAYFKGELTPDMSWYVGIILTIIGQTICVVGLQMQKMSHLIHTPNAAPHKHFEDSLLQSLAAKSTLDASGATTLVDEESFYFVQWRWLFGAIIWALGHIMCWVALGLAPQSILSCLQSWNIVVAFALSPVLLNETLPPHAIECAFMLVIGCIVVVMFGPRTDVYVKETVQTLEMAFHSSSALALHFVCFGLFAVSVWIWAVHDGILRTESYVFMSATCAWYAALFSKSMSMVLITSISEAHIDWHHNFGFWFFLLSFIVFALAQVHFMNMALKHGFACVVMPLFESISMTGQLFFGGILFGEFHNFQDNDQRGFISGVLLVLAGLGFLIRANRANVECGADDADQR